MTLTQFYNDSRVLLAQKKRGFGEGLWNGYGGKVQDGETLTQSALREIEEEAGIKDISIRQAGVLTITFENKPDEAIEIHLFRCAPFEGEAVETEEMWPEWFSYDQIPYDAMWPNDPMWLREFLAGRDIQAEFLLDATMKKVLKAEVRDWEGRAESEAV